MSHDFTNLGGSRSAPMTNQQLPRESVELQKQHAKHLKMAADYCTARGLRLTGLKKQTLGLLWENQHPMSAYSLVRKLARRSGRPVAPTTVYRALAFLEAQCLVAKIQSISAFVPCADPERGADRIFLLCDDCGHAFEIKDVLVEQQMAREAAELGFSASRSMIEVRGRCASCRQPL